MMFAFLFITRLITTAYAQPAILQGTNDLQNAPGAQGMVKYICSVLLCSVSQQGKPLPEFFRDNIIAIIQGLTTGIAVAMIIYAGIRLSMHRGSDDAIERAKDIVIHTLIGVVLVMLTGTIIRYVVGTILPLIFG